MDDLQYLSAIYMAVKEDKVLNLVINGWPSIPVMKGKSIKG